MQDLPQASANTDIGPLDPHAQGSRHDLAATENASRSDGKDTPQPTRQGDDRTTLEPSDEPNEHSSGGNAQENSPEPLYPEVKRGSNLGQTCR